MIECLALAGMPANSRTPPYANPRQEDCHFKRCLVKTLRVWSLLRCASCVHSLRDSHPSSHPAHTHAQHTCSTLIITTLMIMGSHICANPSVRSPSRRCLFVFMCRLLFLGDGAHLPSGLVRCLCLALLTLAAPSVEPNLEDGTSERRCDTLCARA